MRQFEKALLKFQKVYMNDIDPDYMKKLSMIENSGQDPCSKVTSTRAANFQMIYIDILVCRLFLSIFYPYNENFIVNITCDLLTILNIIIGFYFTSVVSIGINNDTDKKVFFLAALIQLHSFRIIGDCHVAETITQLQLSNRQMNDQIEENDVHGAQLVHELRNPLNSMLGSITLLEKTLPTKNLQIIELFSVAKCCGEHLHTLIGNLLEFSKLKKKKIELNNGQVDLKQNVKKIVKMNYFKSKEKNIKLNLYSSMNFPKKVIADEQRINQILINLISNAIKFTEKGSVSVYLGWRQLQTQTAFADDQSVEKGQLGSLQYIEEKYLFKNFGEHITEDSIENQSSSASLLLKLDSRDPHRNSEDYENTKRIDIVDRSRMNRSQSENKNDIYSARLMVRKIKESNKRLNEIKEEEKQPQKNKKLPYESQFKPQTIINDSLGDAEVSGFKSLKFANTTTFIYGKGNNTTFQLNDEEHNTNIANYQNQLEQIDQQPPEPAEDLFKEIDDFLLNDQNDPPKDFNDNSVSLNTYGNLNNNDSSNFYFGNLQKQRNENDIINVFDLDEQLLGDQSNKNENPSDNKKDQKLEEVDNNCTDDFENEVDNFLLQDENVSERLVGQQVRISLEKRDIIHDERHLELQLDQQELWKLDVCYGTPPDKRKSVGKSLKITDAEKQIIERVVEKHSEAQNAFMGMQLIISETLEELPTIRDDPQRGDNSSTLNRLFEEKSEFGQTKFLSDLQSRKNSVLSEENKHEELKEEAKIEIAHQHSKEQPGNNNYFGQSRIDDDLLLSNSLKNARKHSVTITRKDSNDIFNSEKNSMMKDHNVSLNKKGQLVEDEIIHANIEAISQVNTNIFMIEEVSFAAEEIKQSLVYDKKDTLGIRGGAFSTKPTHDNQHKKGDSMINVSALSMSFNNQAKDEDGQKQNSPTNTLKDSRNNILSTPSLGPKQPPKVIKPIELDIIGSSHNNAKSHSHRDNNVDHDNQEKKSNLKLQEFNISPNKNERKNKHITIARQSLFEELKIDTNFLEPQSAMIEGQRGQFERQPFGKRSRTAKKLNITVKKLEEDSDQEKKAQTQNKESEEIITQPPQITPTKRLKSAKLEFKEKILLNEDIAEEAKLKEELDKQLGDIQISSRQDNSSPVKLDKLKIDNLYLDYQSKLKEDSSIDHSTTAIQLKNMDSLQLNVKRFSTICFQQDLQPAEIQIEKASSQSVNMYGTRGFLEIKVVDTGIGISQDGMKRLFQPYNQADKSIQKNYGGTGLGLCICKELINLMNGNISVNSEVGQGTEFKVSIPLEISAEVTLFVEESEFDKEMSEIDLMMYEFCICNHPSSFGLQQIKKYFTKKQSNIYFKEVHELISLNQKNNSQIFQNQKTYKSFIIDYTSTRGSNSNILQILSNHTDQIQLDNCNCNSPQVSPQNINNLASTHSKSFQIKVPVIVLTSPFIDELRVKKSDNIFVLRVPFDAKSLKKMLIFLKKYYQNFIMQRLIKTQSGLVGSLSGMDLDKKSQQDIGHSSNNLSSNMLGAEINRIYSIRDNQQLYSQVTQQLFISNENLYNQTGVYQRSTSNHTDLHKFKENSNHKKDSSQTINTQKRSASVLAQEESLYPKKARMTPDSRNSTGRKSNNIPKKKLTITSIDPSGYNNDQKCLVVNDDQFALRISSMLLDLSKNEYGKEFQIITATNGKEAVEIYKVTSNIKLILMDIEMPIMDGYEATKKIREYEEEVKNGNIMAFIIGVSGNSSAQHFRKCQQAGMNEAVTIPISNNKIIELVTKIF